MRWLYLFPLLLLLASCYVIQRRPWYEIRGRQVRNWVVYYGDRNLSDQLGRFDLAVVNPGFPLPPRSLQKGTIYLGYISVGEVTCGTALWDRIKDKEWIIAKNPNWDSYMVDVRSEEWRNLILTETVPELLDRGFDGVFLDTVDSVIYVQDHIDPHRYKGSKTALMELIKEIRSTYPNLIILPNRGIPLLNEMAPYIDGIVVEGAYSTYDFKESRYIKVPKAERKNILKLVQQASSRYHLPVFTIDYTAPYDMKLIREAIKFSRKYKFIPYISTLNLDNVYFHTLD